MSVRTSVEAATAPRLHRARALGRLRPPRRRGVKTRAVLVAGGKHFMVRRALLWLARAER